MFSKGDRVYVSEINPVNHLQREVMKKYLGCEGTVVGMDRETVRVRPDNKKLMVGDELWFKPPYYICQLIDEKIEPEDWS